MPYSRERAVEEAALLQEKVESQEAGDLDEAQVLVENELEDKAQAFVNRAEEVLRSFTQEDVTEQEYSESWRLNLHIKIKKRLEQKTPENYYLSLRQSTSSMDPEKERILSAATIYEIHHWKEIVEKGKQNKAALMRLAFELGNREALISRAVAIACRKIPLEELNDALIAPQNINKNTQYLPEIAHIAYTRLDTDEKAVAHEALKTVSTALFKETPKSREADANFFYDRAPYYRGEVLQYILNEVVAKDQSQLQALVETFYEELHRTPEELREIERRAQEYSKFGSWGQSMRLMRDVRDHQRRAYFIERLLADTPALNEAYVKFVATKDTERRLQQERREVAEREQREREEQQKKESEQRTEQERAESEQRLLRERQEKEEQLHREANRFMDESINMLNEMTIDDTLFERQLSQAVAQHDKFPVEVLDCQYWQLCEHRGTPLTLGAAENTISNSLNYRGPWYERSDHNKEFGDPEKRDQLRRIWESKRVELRQRRDNMAGTKKDIIADRIAQSFELASPAATLEEYEKRLWDINRFLDELERRMSARESIMDPILEAVRDGVQHVKDQMSERYQTFRSEYEKIEREEELQRLKKDHLLEQIEHHADYLLNLYSAGTGILLHDVKGTALEEPGHVGGSVSMTLRPALIQEQKLVLKLELHAAKDELTLEMGDDMDSIRKRINMVNWVAPHEIAHLVDRSQETVNRLFKENGAIYEQAQTLIGSWKESDRELAGEMLGMTLQETAVDGIGFRLVKEHGTSDPFDESAAQRIAAALRGYVAEFDVLKTILRTHAETPEMKSRYSIIILRAIAAGETLMHEAEKSNVGLDVIEDVDAISNELKDIFYVFNNETGFVADTDILKIINLCKEVFKYSQTVSLARPE